MLNALGSYLLVVMVGIQVCILPFNDQEIGDLIHNPFPLDTREKRVMQM